MTIVDWLAHQLLTESTYEAGAANRLDPEEVVWKRFYKEQDYHDLVEELKNMNTNVDIFNAFGYEFLTDCYLDQFEPFYKMFGRGGEDAQIRKFLELYPEWQPINDVLSRPY